MYLLMVANAWAQLSVEDREREGGVKNVYCTLIRGGVKDYLLLN